MVLVALTCALVGNAGVFGVKIDDSAQVWELKKAIKAENTATITCDAKDLQLSLAKKKKGAGAWLTEKDVKEGVTDTDDLKLLNVAGAPLNLVGLLEKDVKFVPTLEDVESMNTPVHVLVVVPEQAQGQPGLWLVTGSVDNALNTKGIRCRLQEVVLPCIVRDKCVLL
ncbi:unnamed protein product [Phytophthora lilii]|uniref:Unnamed protein product n=1 Tax=Phytophthora lilii TaxID=2077276 RepID=A0A9W6XGT3_9STRA|nr:unnamed protein product [Phytophthora lilii]